MLNRHFAQHLLTLLAFAALFVALTLPNRLEWISLAAFYYFPIELMIIGLLLLLPGRAGSVSRILLAVLLGLSVVLRGSDLVAHEVFARPFNLVFDTHLLADASNLLNGVFGGVFTVLAGLAVLMTILVLCWLAFKVLGRIQRTLRSAPRSCAVALTVMLVGWIALSAANWPRAGNFVIDQLVFHARATLYSVQDIWRFAETVDDDYWVGQPAEPGAVDPGLFALLEGKDVYVVFAESYGRVLLDREPFADSVRATLSSANQQLAAAGVQSRSAFLTSPTVGGLSWLAHASVLSGAWIDSETRYRTLMLSERVTLNKLFRRAGWRTVAAMPGISMAWPEGEYYGYDHIYNAHNFGYAGLPFNWVTMPDQYVLSALHARERSNEDRPPVMAEVALISSHAPWTPVAELVPWDEVGNGEIFNAQTLAGLSPEEVWRDTDKIRDHYRRAIEYMLQALVSYVTEYGDDDLVVLLLGDHQPAPLVSGDPEGKQVPVHLIAKDPDVIAAINSWQWQPGMIPGEDAPVWRMDTLRDRFVRAFSAQPAAGE